MNKMTRAAVLTGGLALTLTACSDDDGDTADASELGLIEAGTLTVCSDIPYPPFEFEDESAPSGFTGFDIDLLQAVADELELELSVIVTGFDVLESGLALANDDCDIAAAAMTITDERAENLGFTEPYYDSLQSLLVASDTGITNLDGFADQSLGVQGATTGADFAHENAPEGTEIIEYPDDGVMFQALQAGNIAGILQDLPVNVDHAQEEGFEIVEEFDTGEQYGFAVKKEGKEDLLETVNDLLTDFRDDGTYDQIYDSYFSTE